VRHGVSPWHETFWFLQVEDVIATNAGGQKMRRFYLIWLSLLVFVSLLALHPTSVHADTYTYDTIGRLTKVTYEDASSITYVYDNAGNLLKRVMLAKVNLADVIHALQVLSGITPSSPVYKEADLNADGKIGLEEVVYILQEVSGLR
jgi:YD repeat-containing protein